MESIQISNEIRQLPTPDVLFSSVFKEQMIRVITYNVLSSALSTPAIYPQCDPAHLNPEVRYTKLEHDLSLLIHGFVWHDPVYIFSEGCKKPVILLQELSLDWCGRLFIFFQSLGYRLIHTNYGHHFNGYMGVGIAVPDSFAIERVVIGLPAEACTWPKRTVGNLSSTVGINDETLPYPICSSSTEIGFDDWSTVKKNTNRYIALCLKRRDRTFWVATFHMPCFYAYPRRLTILNTLLFQRLQDLAGEEALIVGGDFNYDPASEQYLLLTTGVAPVASAPGLGGAPSNWIGSIPHTMAPIQPAHYTCRTHMSSGYTGCIDHIFYSGPIELYDTESIRYPDTIMPNSTHGSDHLPVGAFFDLL